MYNDDEHKNKKMKYDIENVLSKQNVEIIGSDIKITSYNNARILLNGLINHTSYRECIYSLYSNDIFRAVPLQIRRRILYEKFYDIKEIMYNRYLDEIKNENIKNFFQFTGIIKKYGFYESIEDKLEFYEFFMKTMNKDYTKFRDLFLKKNYSVSTSLHVLQNEKEFDFFERNLIIEYFYVILKEFEKKMDSKNIKNYVIRFLFLLQDLYENGSIHYKMNYQNLLPLIQNNPIYDELLHSSYSPIDIYSYYMSFLEKRLKSYENNVEDAAISSVDRRALQIFNDAGKDEREEGEI